VTNIIAIIGMGASGTLVMRELAKILPKSKEIEILLFEPAALLGPGIPYGNESNDDSFLLNMRSCLLGANEDNVLEFVEWLEKNNIAHDAGQSYLKRSIYGRYLHHIAECAINDLQKKGIKVSIIQIQDIEESQGKYSLIVDSKHKFTADDLVLAIGHLQKTPCFTETDKYITNPYNNLELLKGIPNTAAVGILGTKLTAVDIAILLKKCGHSKIHMFSRSGLLPESQPHIANKSPAAMKFAEPEQLSIAAFFAAYLQQTNRKLSQPLLDTSKHFIDKYWRKISSFQKHLFINKYKGWWMSHRHPMPACNAEKLQDMIDSGILTIHKKYKELSFNPQSLKFQVELGNECVSVDYVVDATGTSQDVTKIDSQLVQNLLNKNILVACEFGGVKINCETMQAHNQNNMYVIGHLTHGSLFYVASMERLLVHAGIIVQNISKKIVLASQVKQMLDGVSV
jgi:uncharacterized NAD(P)/FAD-binding protein YdhS